MSAKAGWSRYFMFAVTDDDAGAFASDASQLYQHSGDTSIAVLAERLNRLSEHVPGVLHQFVLYPDGHAAFPYVSKGVYRTYGVTAEQAVADANTIFSVLHPDDLPRVQQSIRLSAQNLSLWKEEFRVCPPGQPERWLNGQASPQPLDDGAVLWHGYVYDITEIVQARQALEQAKAQAEQASQEKTIFMASMSHEVRTSLAGIVGLGQLGLEDTDPAVLHDRLQKISQSARNLLELLNDVLDFSRIEARRLPLESRPFVLSDAITPVVNLFEPLAREKGLDLQVQANGLDVNVYRGDVLRLRQVLQNLFSNALKFTAQGKISLAVVIETCTDSTDWVRFTLQDTGIGITEAQRGRLFKAFSQADNSIGRKYGGSGLGLIISQRLVHAMGGADIELDSQPGLGTTFSFVLPLQRSPAGAHDTAPVTGAAVAVLTSAMAAGTSSMAAPATVDYLNATEGIQRLMGDKALYRKSLGQLHQQLLGPYARLGQILDHLGADSMPADFAAAQSLVHSLKGVAGNLAMKELASVASLLDASLKQNQVPEPGLVARFENIRQAHVQQAGQYLAEHASNEGWDMNLEKPADQTRVRAALAKLAAAISGSQFIGEDELIAVARLLPASVREHHWPAVEQALDALDFDAAAQAMKPLLAALGN